MYWTTAQRSGSGGNGTRLGADVAQARGLGVAAVEQVERGAAAEAGGADAEAGVAGGVGEAAADARCRRRREKRLQVSIAPPQRWVKRRPSSCGKVWKKCWASVANVGVVLVVARADRAAEAVDRVPAAVEDAVVGGQAVVVELVAAVADALAVLPSRSRAAARASSGSVTST